MIGVVSFFTVIQVKVYILHLKFLTKSKYIMLSHFVNYAEGDHEYSHQRYANEYNRCIGVLERRLEGRDYILGDDYSVVDMASWPWILIAKPLGQSLDEFPNVARWRQTVKERPAVQAGVDLGKELRRTAPPTDEERELLYHQTAASTRAHSGQS
jgi:GST-like protein